MEFPHTLQALPEEQRARILKMRRTLPRQKQEHFDKMFDGDRLQCFSECADETESMEVIVFSALIGMEKELKELREAIRQRC